MGPTAPLRKRVTKARSLEQQLLLSQAISDLVSKGAVRQVVEQEDQFLSTLFIVQQVNKNRSVFNLKTLNKYVHTEKFKLESLDRVTTVTTTFETERRSNETGPEGCVLLGTSSSGTQEVPSISFSRCDLRVPVFTLRSIISTPSLHETGQASYCNPENIWHTSSDIFRRPTAFPPGSNRATENLQDCNHPIYTHRPRVYHQTREVLNITHGHTSNHISGRPAELNGHDNSCSSGETLPHTVGVQKDPDQGVVLHAGTFSIAGSNESDCPNWNLGSTIALSSPSTDVHCGHTQERSLHTIKAVPDSSNKGSILRTQVMVFGATKSNQLDGVEPSSNRHDSIGICQGHHASTPYSGAYGQFHGSVPHKQARGDTFPNSGMSGIRDMELLHLSADIDYSETCSWSDEHRSRFCIEELRLQQQNGL